MVQPLWRTVWKLLKKLEIEIPYDPEIPFLGIYPEETKTEKYTCIAMFIAALQTLMLGKIEGEEATEDEMVGWHHQLDGHEFEQVLGAGDQ